MSPILNCLLSVSIFLLALRNAQAAPGAGSCFSRSDLPSTFKKLPISPVCGSASSSKAENCNNGIQLSNFKTIVTFGDSYSDTGTGNGRLAPATAHRTGNGALCGGRASDAGVWPEYLAACLGDPSVLNYAIGGSTVDHTLWIKRDKNADMVGEVQKFISAKPAFEPKTTLATVLMGLNDYAAVSAGPGTLPQAADRLVSQIELLVTKGGIENILMIGAPVARPAMQAFNDVVWAGVQALAKKHSMNIAFVDASPLFEAVRSNMASFGFTSLQSCLPTSSSGAGACSDPEKHMLYLPSHPSAVMHQFLASWISSTLEKCSDTALTSKKESS